MNERKVYSSSFLPWRILFVFLRVFFFTFILSIHGNVFAQQEPEYDEIPVFLEIPRVGGFEIPAVIKNEDLYLPVTDLFNFLKIRNVPSGDLETITGFFINPEAEYFISRPGNSIKYQDKTFNLEPGDLIRTESNLFLKSQYFGKIFGMDCSFSFRSLSVKLSSKLDLPLIREMRQEEMRQNLRRLKGETKADTVIKRTYPVFRFGMADWSAFSSQEINGKTDARLNLNLGSMIAGGEATASLNYNTTDPFSEKQQYYLWRYVDNDYNLFKQAMIGKIATQATSTIFNPVVGVQFTNTPTTYRRSFGSYTLTDRTEPGWIVELYVNNVLVDYVKADASGFFKFEVPLVYGNSIIQLKFFGPWGEERVREQNINIPFNFLPEKTLEYKASAGVVEDSSLSRFSKLSVNYGVTRRLTVGAGVEYLSSVTSSPVMPYVNVSVSLLNNLLLSGEYTHGVRSKGTLSYRMPSNIQFDLNYTRYDKDQKAIIYNYLEERRASVSLPLKIKKFSSYNRLSVYQIVLPLSKYTTGEWMMSASLFGINSNLTTYAIIIDRNDPYLYSNLSLSLRLPAGFVIMPQAQYGYSQKEFLSGKVGIEKRIKEKAFLNLSFEQNFINNMKMGEIGFRYNFYFAQTGFSVRQTNKKTSFIEYARGSLIYDKKTKFLGADNQFNVGKGGISVIPYIDLNANGIKDPGEPKAYGLNLRANGGRIEKSEKDTTIIILGLEPYTECFIELDANSFENISWRLPVKTLNVAVDPDILKHIEIPVSVAGEATGSVMVNKDGKSEGQGRVIVSIFNKYNKLIGSTLTEDDGFFSWFGLVPGQYRVRIDTSQLGKLGMVSDPVARDFSIAPGLDGDIADKLDFNLSLLLADTASQTRKPVAGTTKKDTSYVIVHEVTRELITITKDSYAIQLGAFRNKANADNLRRNLAKILGRNVEIIIEDNFYKVRINGIETREEVDKIIEILKNNGITELWVISLKARQQQLIVTEKLDSVIQVLEMKTFMNMGDQFYKLRTGETSVIKPIILDMMKMNPAVKSPEVTEMKIIRKIDNEKTTIIDRIYIEKVGNVIEIPQITPPQLIPGLIKAEPVSPVKQPVQKLKVKDAMDVKDVSNIKPDTIAVKEPAAVKPQPTIAIQVAIFYKKSEALRAQRRISSKLKVPVEIVEQWEFFRVIIPGFFTREETYRFYPELAGLGYPGITIIENK
jgi:hypothetical protein